MSAAANLKARQLRRGSRFVMTDVKRRVCELDAAAIAYYRNNPCIAAEDLLGVRLFDAQKYILQSSWNAEHVLWCCSRNFGKSFLGAVFILLKAMLYENQAIYIISSVGDQAKETFTKIEELVLRLGKTAASFKDLKDIAEHETKKSASNKTGFSHNPAGFEVSFYNGSSIYTLNSKPDSARSRRATLVFFDEAAFCSDELIAICEAFATQNTDFVTSTDDSYDPTLEASRVPTQLVYASSQDEMDKLFYKHYKEFAKQMLAGNKSYFVCDMICDTAINVYMNGKQYKPLLTRDKVDAALKADKDKALREYYNQPTRDGGDTQIVKWATIRNNSKQIIPYCEWRPDNRIALAFDPSRMGDNSIISAMNMYEDPSMGLCGDIINCENMIDTASKKKLKLDANRQLERLQDIIVSYNGDNPDYEYIDTVLIDAGSGGGGQSSYADRLLENWKDKRGITHRGLIDRTYEAYAGYEKRYPNAVDKLRLISPRKYRTQMVEEFIELMDLGVIRLPFDYNGQDFIRINKGAHKEGDAMEEVFETYNLSQDEIIAFTQIDLAKTEITSIHKFQNAERTSVSYALAKDKENRMHDDRFYTMIMLAHRLYELRRGTALERSKHKTKKDFSAAFQIRKPQIY